ncbi:MAG: ATP-dependent Clp protease ATP-binding subunit [Candidatus Magasanikbacteria bacterium]|nr:ATP-dependent Clp protease ATP-binding subunit [Candidatus Magasanikbacteria bacterium]
MHLIERFSAHLRDVLARAIHLATELKNPEVAPIHLLFALSNQKGSVASEIIGRFKILPQMIEQVLISLPTIAADENIIASGNASGNTLQAVLTPLSDASKNALEKAMSLAHTYAHAHIGTEHLLFALIKLENTEINDLLKISDASQAEILKQLDTVLRNAAQFPDIAEAADMAERLEDHLNNFSQSEKPPGGHGAKPQKNRKESALEFFAMHLTDAEAQKNIDPVIGRADEIERVVQILCRRTKNNPLLLGEPGVGKTAIVEGLAKRILAGDVPEALLNKKIYGLDMGLLIAGTIYRGEFEGRLRQVVEEVTNDERIILFIDEVHNIVGAGSNQGTMDAANLLKPALARGQIRCIGATTPAEFKKHIEGDAALERRFQPVLVKEPNVEDTIKILRGIKKNYESYHRVEIEDAALEAAARLSDRYITGKHLPDKAIDILDETAAGKRLSAKVPAAITKRHKLEQRLTSTNTAKAQAVKNDNFAEAMELKKREELLRAEIKKIDTELNGQVARSVGTVTADDIIAQVAKIIGTKPSELIIRAGAETANLEEDLQKFVVGQTQAINEVARLVRQAQLGLSHPDRPLASFLFVGESGVGKTELAKTLAKVLYQDKDALIKLDMSEFNESFSVSKLLGSPAGYVGYKESNQFTDKLKLHPYAVVLFDEIDKAHRDVVRLLLQILENGEITDASGKNISLKHAIIILTTSLGAAEIKRGSLGFGTNAVDKDGVKKRLVEKLKEYFSPEIISRLDQICWFEPLTVDSLVKIAELEINQFNERLVQYHTTVKSSDKILARLISQLGTEYGAREVRRTVRRQVEDFLTSLLLQNKIKQNYTIGMESKKLVLK